MAEKLSAQLVAEGSLETAGRYVNPAPLCLRVLRPRENDPSVDGSKGVPGLGIVRRHRGRDA